MTLKFSLFKKGFINDNQQGIGFFTWF